MNLYGLIAIMLLTVILGNYFQLQEPVKDIFEGIAQIFQFQNKGKNPAITDMAYVMILLLAVVGIINSLVRRKSDSDDE
jgi:hypothetical protein